MKYLSVLKTFLVLSLMGPVVAQTLAADMNALKDGDKLAVFLQKISSAERGGESVRIRAALCVAKNKCKEITITPVIQVNAGESIDFEKKELKQRRSQVFSGEDINDRLQKLAEEKASEVSDPNPQIAIMLVRVDTKGKILEKSDSVYIDFPKKEATSKDGKIANEVKLKLRSIEAKLSVAIERN